MQDQGRAPCAAQSLRPPILTESAAAKSIDELSMSVKRGRCSPGGGFYAELRKILRPPLVLSVLIFKRSSR